MRKPVIDHVQPLFTSPSCRHIKDAWYVTLEQFGAPCAKGNTTGSRVTMSWNFMLFSGKALGAIENKGGWRETAT
jgi:hypothetical protein